MGGSSRLTAKAVICIAHAGWRRGDSPKTHGEDEEQYRDAIQDGIKEEYGCREVKICLAVCWEKDEVFNID